MRNAHASGPSFSLLNRPDFGLCNQAGRIYRASLAVAT